MNLERVYNGFIAALKGLEAGKTLDHSVGPSALETIRIRDALNNTALYLNEPFHDDADCARGLADRVCAKLCITRANKINEIANAILDKLLPPKKDRAP